MATTGFEDSGGTLWTTNAEESAYLTDISAQYGRVEVEVAGQSVNNQDIPLVRIGSSREEGCGVLVIANQHGDEPSGREAALIWVRELASSSIDLIDEQGVWIMPNVNPDNAAQGSSTGARTNANGVDINRQHFPLNEPEARAVAEVLRDANAVIILDLHETNQRSLGYHSLELYYPSGLQVDSGIVVESRRLVDSVGDVVIAQNANWGWTYFNGGMGENVLRNCGGLRNSHTILVEIEGQHASNPPLSERVDLCKDVLQASLEYAQDNPSLVDNQLAAQRRRIGEGFRQKRFFMANGNTLSPAPYAYCLSSNQISQAEFHLDVFNVKLDGALAYMGNPWQPVLPHIVDASADYNVVSGASLGLNVVGEHRLFDGEWRATTVRRHDGQGWPIEAKKIRY